MYIFVTSILSISCIILHMVKLFHIKIRKISFRHNYNVKISNPPLPPKRHIEVKRGNLTMDVTPTLCHDNNIQLLFSTYEKVQSIKKVK